LYRFVLPKGFESQLARRVGWASRTKEYFREELTSYASAWLKRAHPCADAGRNVAVRPAKSANPCNPSIKRYPNPADEPVIRHHRARICSVQFFQAWASSDWMTAETPYHHRYARLHRHGDSNLPAWLRHASPFEYIHIPVEGA